jgi:PAS domain S-box-containing protein
MQEDPVAYKILVVEDEPTQRLKLAGILDAAGYRTEVACNGDEALATALKSLPHLILSDIEMPGMDGYELCGRIRADKRLRATKVVLLTSHSDIADVVTGLMKGADNYIAKPFDVDGLLDVVRNLLARGVDVSSDESSGALLVPLDGKLLEVRSTRQQILNFFISIYRDAAVRNEELSRAHGELRNFSAKLTQLVDQKTAGLQESERRYREMLETVNLIAMTLDTNGRVTFCNDFLVKLIGWSRKEVLGRDWFEAFIPEEAAHEKDIFFTSLKRSEIPVHHENFIKTRAGELRSIQWNNTLLRDAAGTIVGTASIGEDVTERRRAEQKAIRLAAIVESSEDAIASMTLEGVITSWNKGAETIYGYTESEVAGKRIAPFLVPRTGEGVLEKVLGRIAKGKHIEHYEILNRRKDGEDIYVSVSMSPITDGDGNVIAASVIGRDVTLRKRAEEEKRRSEEQFRLITENVADMIAVVDTDGRRIYNSPSYRSILGDPDSLRGTDGFQEIHPDDVQRVKRVFQETVSTGVGQRIEYRFVRKDGSIRTIDSKGSVIRDGAGKLIQVIVVSRDITEEKKLASQFLRAQRMESIGTLAGGISHDLNNVLTPIMMSIDVLRGKVADPEGQTTLDTLESSAKRGAAIVKQVLAFGRGIEGDRSLVQLKHIVKEVVKIAGATLSKAIVVRTDVSRDLWTVSADPTQMHQVLLNLIVNARDAMAGRGTLTIAAENISLDESYSRMHIDARPGDYVAITIADTGSGIPEDIRDKIFEPFFTTKEVGMGTGLGLSTTLGIVKSHGGFIDLESEVGKGTAFRIFLPATGMVSGEDAAAEKPDIPMGHGEMILVIDDEAAIRDITKGTLEAHGYRAVTAGDGAEGVAVFAENKKYIKVVITDIMMPVMDGRAAIPVLSRIDPDVKIITASGMTGRGEPVIPLGDNVKGHLTKPFTAEKLLTAVAAAIGLL